MPVTQMAKDFVRKLGSGQNVDKLLKNRRTAVTLVLRHIDQRATTPAAYSARAACIRRHQLKLSGLGSLKGRSLGRFWGFGLGFGLVCFGMGKGFGLG